MLFDIASETNWSEYCDRFVHFGIIKIAYIFRISGSGIARNINCWFIRSLFVTLISNLEGALNGEIKLHSGIEWDWFIYHIIICYYKSYPYTEDNNLFIPYPIVTWHLIYLINSFFRTREIYGRKVTYHSVSHFARWCQYSI